MAASPTLDAASFFAGETESVGTLHRVLRRPCRMVVRGTGRYVDGRLLLTQRILVQYEPVRTRTWDVHRVAPGQWRGTLSDGAGPVTMVTTGNQLHIRFPTGTGLVVNQFLYLRPDGRTATDHTLITKFGDDWARVDETVRHVD